jgi:hypothetical protein
MEQPLRLSDRELFAARPWRAADRSQIIIAVVEGVAAQRPGWHVVLARLDGGTLYSKALEQQRSPGSFTDTELQVLYNEARGTIHA